MSANSQCTQPQEAASKGPVLLISEAFSTKFKAISASLTGSFRCKTAKKLRGADFLLPVPERGISIAVKYLDFQSSHGKDDTPERKVDKVAKIHKVLYVMVPQEKFSDERLYGDFQLKLPDNVRLIPVLGTVDGCTEMLLQLQKLNQPDKASIVKRFWQQQLEKCYSQEWIAQLISKHIPQFDGDERSLCFLFDVVGSLADLAQLSKEDLLTLDAPLSEAAKVEIFDFLHLEYEAEYDSQ